MTSWSFLALFSCFSRVSRVSSISVSSRKARQPRFTSGALHSKSFADYSHEACLFKFTVLSYLPIVRADLGVPQDLVGQSGLCFQSFLWGRGVQWDPHFLSVLVLLLFPEFLEGQEDHQSRGAQETPSLPFRQAFLASQTDRRLLPYPEHLSELIKLKFVFTLQPPF